MLKFAAVILIALVFEVLAGDYGANATDRNCTSKNGECMSAASDASPVLRPQARPSAQNKATIHRALNLNNANLLGIYYFSGIRSALVRMSDGKRFIVKVGDEIDGGKVAAIGLRELRYVKDGKNVTLELVAAGNSNNSVRTPKFENDACERFEQVKSELKGAMDYNDLGDDTLGDLAEIYLIYQKQCDDVQRMEQSIANEAMDLLSYGQIQAGCFVYANFIDDEYSQIAGFRSKAEAVKVSQKHLEKAQTASKELLKFITDNQIDGQSLEEKDNKYCIDGLCLKEREMFSSMFFFGWLQENAEKVTRTKIECPKGAGNVSDCSGAKSSGSFSIDAAKLYRDTNCKFIK